jgi:hypothetical protein
LIRYASLNSIEKGEPFRITPRMIGYTVVLAVLAAALAFLVFTRSDVQTTLLRAPGALFQLTPDGQISNLYVLKLVNKSSHDVPVQLRLAHPTGTLKVMGGTEEIMVPKEQLAQTSVLIELPPDAVTAGSVPLEVGVYSGERLLETVDTVFIGPRH